MNLVNIFKNFFWTEPVKNISPAPEPIPPTITKPLKDDLDSREEESYTILGEKDSRLRKYKKSIRNKTKTVKKFK